MSSKKRKTAKAPRRAAPADVALSWVKPAQQSRSRQTHDRIVEAAERLLARGRSWDAISVAELAKEAGASVGAFYNRFHDKDALLHVLQIELHRAGAATAGTAQALGTTESISLEQLLRLFVELGITVYRQQFGLRRALLQQMYLDADFRTRAVELARETCAAMVPVLATHVPWASTRDVETVVDVCHRMIYGVLDQNLLFYDMPATGRALSDEDLTAEITQACLAYVERRLPRPQPGQ